ncbi:SRPBCC family protein [Flavobacterium sp.]|uniref:SRPBCC family protein n=1 Tax=Flavobacterium sp. TaxID=239 RepID=UPI0039E3A5AC
MYSFHRIQKFPVPIEKIWAFISDPKNLAVITPPEMGFQTLSGDERPMFPGQIIHYTITPLFGIKMEWVTEITHVEHLNYFVDEQRHGPYKFWHHKHFLREIPGGVEMEDLIHYKVPMGFLGRIFHPILVRPNLEKIFEFRRQQLIELFGEFKMDAK